MLSFLKFISIIGLCIIISACATIRPEPCVKNGKVYGVTKGLFRGKFWNYYDAALSYTDGACWQEAELAFEQAIHLNNTDEQWTMTYGLRFINYFPHRELGIVYLFQGKFKQAIQELERSIQQQHSGRGMFYLNTARKCQALSQKNDRLKPQIVIESPEKNNCTSDYAIVITGIARDDTLIERILVNDYPLKIDDYEKEIYFEKNIHIQPGNNDIIIKAIDVFGNESAITHHIFLDIQGPALSLDSVEKTRELIHIKGTIYDTSGIASVSIYNTNKAIYHQQPEGKQFIHLDDHIPFVNQPLILTAEDMAGNQTQIPLNISQTKSSDRHSISSKIDHQILLASNFMPMPLLTSNKTTHNKSLLIELEGIKDIQTVYFDDILLKLKVSGMNAIKSVFIDHNGNRISGTSSYSKKHTIGKQYCINLNVQLIEGENRFTIKVNDDQQQTEKTVIIHKKKLEIDDVNMTIAMIPVKDKPFKPDLETLLLESFNQTKRFNIVGLGLSILLTFIQVG